MHRVVPHSLMGLHTACLSACDAVSELGHEVILNFYETLHDLDLIVHRNSVLVVLAIKYNSIEYGINIWLFEYL